MDTHFSWRGCPGDRPISCFVTTMLCQMCFPSQLPGFFSSFPVPERTTLTFLRLQFNSNSCSRPTLQPTFKEAHRFLRIPFPSKIPTRWGSQRRVPETLWMRIAHSFTTWSRLPSRSRTPGAPPFQESRKEGDSPVCFCGTEIWLSAPGIFQVPKPAGASKYGTQERVEHLWGPCTPPPAPRQDAGRSWGSRGPSPNASRTGSPTASPSRLA